MKNLVCNILFVFIVSTTFAQNTINTKDNLEFKGTVKTSYQTTYNVKNQFRKIKKTNRQSYKYNYYYYFSINGILKNKAIYYTDTSFADKYTYYYNDNQLDYVKGVEQRNDTTFYRIDTVTYDKYNNIINRKILRKSNQNYEINYDYNEKQLLIEKTKMYGKDTLTKTTFNYYKTDTLNIKQYFKYTDNKLLYSEISTYDCNGLLKEFEVLDKHLKITEKTIYFYNSYHLLDSTKKNFNNDIGRISFGTKTSNFNVTHFYNSNNNLILSNYYNVRDNSLEMVTEYIYNDKNLFTEKTVNYMYNGEAYKAVHQYFTYDKKNNLTKDVMIHHKNRKTIIKEYDVFDNWIKISTYENSKIILITERNITYYN